MKKLNFFSVILFASLWSTTNLAHAFFFFFPIPNLAKPPALQNLVNALEKSSETKALAYVSEDKTFGGKMWVWGHFSGVTTQEDANSKALRACEQSLNKASTQLAGGQAIHNFGSKKCELYEFTNKTLKLPVIQDSKEPTSPAVDESKSETPKPPQSSATATDTNVPALLIPQSLESKLKQLQSLFEQKLISKEEYEQKKKTLLDAL